MHVIRKRDPSVDKKRASGVGYMNSVEENVDFLL
jgi:hypothetical protein